MWLFLSNTRRLLYVIFSNIRRLLYYSCITVRPGQLWTAITVLSTNIFDARALIPIDVLRKQLTFARETAEGCPSVSRVCSLHTVTEEMTESKLRQRRGRKTEDSFRSGWIKDLPLSVPLFLFAILRSGDSPVPPSPSLSLSLRVPSTLIVVASITLSPYTVKLIVRLIGLTMRLSIQVTPRTGACGRSPKMQRSSEDLRPEKFYGCQLYGGSSRGIVSEWKRKLLERVRAACVRCFLRVSMSAESAFALPRTKCAC